MMHWIRNFILLALMLAASGMAMALRPTHKLADEGPAVDLQEMVPSIVGDWREVPQSSAQIVDPVQKEVIDRIYKQTLTRSYINGKGAHVMLSIAYGDNQSDSVQLHYPEVCYPAQGFQVHSREKGVLETGYGKIRVVRLMTQLGNRPEPVTYWSTLGTKIVQGGMDTKLTQLNYSLKGQIPDGMIFRVSTIDPIPERAYETQALFVEELLASVAPAVRQRLAPMN